MKLRAPNLARRNDPRRLGVLEETKSARYRNRALGAGLRPLDRGPRHDFRVSFVGGIAIEITNTTRDVVENRAVAFLCRERRIRPDVVLVEQLPADPKRHAERLKEEPVRYHNLSTLRIF